MEYMISDEFYQSCIAAADAEADVVEALEVFQSGLNSFEMLMGVQEALGNEAATPELLNIFNEDNQLGTLLNLDLASVSTENWSSIKQCCTEGLGDKLKIAWERLLQMITFIVRKIVGWVKKVQIYFSPMERQLKAAKDIFGGAEVSESVDLGSGYTANDFTRVCDAIERAMGAFTGAQSMEDIAKSITQLLSKGRDVKRVTATADDNGVSYKPNFRFRFSDLWTDSVPEPKELKLHGNGNWTASAMSAACDKIEKLIAPAKQVVTVADKLAGELEISVKSEGTPDAAKLANLRAKRSMVIAIYSAAFMLFREVNGCVGQLSKMSKAYKSAQKAAASK